MRIVFARSDVFPMPVPSDVKNKSRPLLIPPDGPSPQPEEKRKLLATTLIALLPGAQVSVDVPVRAVVPVADQTGKLSSAVADEVVTVPFPEPNEAQVVVPVEPMVVTALPAEHPEAPP